MTIPLFGAVLTPLESAIAIAAFAAGVAGLVLPRVLAAFLGRPADLERTDFDAAA
jgi:hypothetical protein